jgi:hypothetical protein
MSRVTGDGEDNGGEQPFDDEEPFQGTREEMARAMRRLDVLEWMILAFAIIVALLGGAMVAFILSAGTELPFRATWAVISILLLAVPGIFVFGREMLGNGEGSGGDGPG